MKPGVAEQTFNDLADEVYEQFGVVFNAVHFPANLPSLPRASIRLNCALRSAKTNEPYQFVLLEADSREGKKQEQGYTQSSVHGVLMLMRTAEFWHPIKVQITEADQEAQRELLAELRAEADGVKWPRTLQGEETLFRLNIDVAVPNRERGRRLRTIHPLALGEVLEMYLDRALIEWENLKEAGLSDAEAGKLLKKRVTEQRASEEAQRLHDLLP